MRAAQTAWWGMMHGKMDQMKTMLTTVSTTRSTQSFLLARIPRMQALSIALLTACGSRPPRHNEQRPSTVLALCLFLEDFTTFVPRLVSQLDRLGARLSSTTACSIGSAEEDLFWALWGFLIASSAALTAINSAFIDIWPPTEHPLCTSLHSSFHTLFTWLLPMSQSPAWVAMLPEHGRLNRNRGLILILSGATAFLSNSLETSCAASSTHDHQPTFLPLLCSIASEQFMSFLPVLPDLPSDPPAQPQATVNRQGLPDNIIFQRSPRSFLTFLTNYINNGIIESQHTHIGSAVSFLTASSVLLYLKQFLSLPREASHTRGQDLLNLLCLNKLCRRSLNLSEANLFTLPASGDSSRLPLHLNPLPSQKALAVDGMLLHTLSGRMVYSSDELLVCLEIQTCVLESWQDACYASLAPAKVLVVIASSLVGLAKQCMTYAMQLLRQLQQVEQIQSQPRLLATHQHQQQVQQQPQEHVQTTPQTGMQLAHFSVAVLSQINIIMRHTSYFKLVGAGHGRVDGE